MLTEDDWQNTEAATTAYEKSKGIAEKAAWEFVAQLPSTHSVASKSVFRSYLTLALVNLISLYVTH